jgi:hypothetical protein
MVDAKIDIVLIVVGSRALSDDYAAALFYLVWPASDALPDFFAHVLLGVKEVRIS